MDDQDWLTDLLAQSRREPEPVWTPDKETIAAGGRRRRRLRTASVGGGLVGALAVTAAVVIGLGGIAGVSAAPEPGGKWSTSTSVLDYADISPNVEVSDAGKPGSYVLPASAVAKMSRVIDLLDPMHAHLRNTTSGPLFRGPHYRPVEDASPMVKTITTVKATSVYTTDGKAPDAAAKAADGVVTMLVAATSSELGRSAGSGSGAQDAPDVSKDNLPCGYALASVLLSTQPTNPPPHWSQCTSMRLTDGSKVDSASTPDGEGTMTVAIREYPNNGGGVAVVWRDYLNWKGGLLNPMALDPAPDPSMVLKPNPYSEAEVIAALSDPALGRAGAPKAGAGSGPKQFLKTGDLGADAKYDPSTSNGSTGDLPMDNGCEYKDVNPLAKPGRMASYTVTAPGTKKVTVSELEYPLAAGTGPATMATARSQAKGGCDQHGALFSKDTARDLPAGIGDEAFVENGVGAGAVTVWMRFGDTILRIDVTQGQSVPDLSGTADQAWLLEVARAAAGHWTAGD